MKARKMVSSDPINKLKEKKILAKALELKAQQDCYTPSKAEIAEAKKAVAITAMEIKKGTVGRVWSEKELLTISKSDSNDWKLTDDQIQKLAIANLMAVHLKLNADELKAKAERILTADAGRPISDDNLEKEVNAEAENSEAEDSLVKKRFAEMGVLKLIRDNTLDDVCSEITMKSLRIHSDEVRKSFVKISTKIYAGTEPKGNRRRQYKKVLEAHKSLDQLANLDTSENKKFTIDEFVYYSIDIMGKPFFSLNSKEDTDREVVEYKKYSKLKVNTILSKHRDLGLRMFATLALTLTVVGAVVGTIQALSGNGYLFFGPTASQILIAFIPFNIINPSYN